MNYYEHHIGDYDQATAHLTACEDGIYSRMIRRYYATEKPLPADVGAVQRLVRARTKEERQAVTDMLAEFFVLKDDGWHQQRCDEDLARYHRKQEKARASANARWGKPQCEGNANAYADAMRTHSEGNAPRARSSHHTPDTNHQTPERAESPRKRGSRLSVSELPDDWRLFCQQDRPDLDPEATFQRFADYWRGIPGTKGVKLDWDATWRNWVRGERPGTLRVVPDYSSILTNLTDGV